MIRIATMAFLTLASTSYCQAQAPAAPLDVAGDQVVSTIWASGVQIYDCKPASSGQNEWSFRSPRADLYLGSARIGKHYAGPSWEHDDGSKVTGKVAGRMDASFAGAIPHLRLDATQAAGAGAFASVTAIQRVNTRGGSLAGACPMAGEAREVPYTADYIMMRKGG